MSQDPAHWHPFADPADPRRISRREALRLGAGALASAAVAPGLFAGRLEGQAPTRAPLDLIHRAIPASGEEIPVIGMGTWQTFMVEDREEGRGDCADGAVHGGAPPPQHRAHARPQPGGCGPAP